VIPAEAVAVVAAGIRGAGETGDRGAALSQQLEPQNEPGSIGFTYDDFAMDVATVSPKFQVVIPKRVREQFGLSPGQILQVIALPGRIELVPTQTAAALRGFLPGKNTFQREGDRL
jgi:AbrB family looped-hinge helix DNA binding protein